jgi:hypothetical protein
MRIAFCPAYFGILYHPLLQLPCPCHGPECNCAGAAAAGEVTTGFGCGEPHRDCGGACWRSHY